MKKLDIFLIKEPLNELIHKIQILETAPLSYTRVAEEFCGMDKIGQIEVDIPQHGDLITLRGRQYRVRYLDWNYPHFGGLVSVWVERQ